MDKGLIQIKNPLKCNRLYYNKLSGVYANKKCVTLHHVMSVIGTILSI